MCRLSLSVGRHGVTAPHLSRCPPSRAPFPQLKNDTHRELGEISVFYAVFVICRHLFLLCFPEVDQVSHIFNDAIDIFSWSRFLVYIILTYFHCFSHASVLFK